MNTFKTCLLILVLGSITLSGCNKDDDSSTTTTTPTNNTNASCSDGIQNQGETGVDCGGPCPPCETCDDGIQNQDETGIDCGGTICPPCPEPQPSAEYFIKAKIDDEWMLVQSSYPATLGFGGDINGTYLDWDFGAAFQNTQSNLNGLVNDPVSFGTGTNKVQFGKGDLKSDNVNDQSGKSAVITKVDLIDPNSAIFGDEFFKVSGTFKCNASVDGTDIKAVTSGTFTLKVEKD